jgi:cell division protein ZapE
MERVCSNLSLLCLDEIEIKDIADAMIIGRVLEFLISSNIIMITTSNRHPQELYKDGLHRDRFLLTIHTICKNLLILNLDSNEDYRLRKRQSMPHYLSGLTPSTQEELLNIFKGLTDSGPVSPLSVTIWDRDIVFNRYASKVLWANFRELCEANLAAGDYLALCGHLQTLIIDEVPPFAEWEKDLWRRFILLIDVLYDQHKVIFIRSADPLSKLLDPSHDWSFELGRTHSRLMEMQSW